MELLTEVGTLDRTLQEHDRELGTDLVPYRNHTYRVLNFCSAISATGGANVEKIAIAAAFHDLGIWVDRTFDYLEPSVRLANDHLVERGLGHWKSEIDAMIHEHHKLLPARSGPTSLVEAFRRADWVDVTMGLIPCGLPRRFIRKVYDVWPSAGFHRRLVQLSIQRARAHPLSPLPMVRL